MSKFANRDIEDIFFDALTMTHCRCDGCGNMFPVGQAQRLYWEFTVCQDCFKLGQEGRLSFRTEELLPYPEDDSNHPQGCSRCGRPMKLSTWRVLDGIEQPLFTRWTTCRDCEPTMSGRHSHERGM